ncbi:uncharacterized protein LOC107365121 [Tetranychus urticae]|uniref:Gustatory receptor n=1 Tax=Tetranychus urticae TaxID=32264 RepID=T1KL39_TETUR|nr:uncharacterized protein LOC107365121 [Tetranychus urticae]
MSSNLIKPFQILGQNKIPTTPIKPPIPDHLRFRILPIFPGRVNLISFLTFTLLFASTLGHDIAMFFGYLPRFDFCGLLTFSGSSIITVLGGDIFINALLVIVFLFPLDYSQYEEAWRLVGFSLNDPFITDELKRAKKETLIFAILFLITWLCYLPGCVYIAVIQPHEAGLIQMAFETSHQVSYPLVGILVFIKVHTLFTSSSLIRASFILIKKSIKAHPEVTWSLQSLRYYRQIYTATIELTSTANNIWSAYLSFMYPAFNIMGLVSLYTMISGSYDFSRYFILGSSSLSLFWTSSFMNKYIIGINVEAASVYDVVYQKSLLDLGEKYMMETMLFLERIGRADVGYRLHGSFVFSPTLMASMVTLGVTIIIAFPSFAH